MLITVCIHVLSTFFVPHFARCCELCGASTTGSSPAMKRSGTPRSSAVCSKAERSGAKILAMQYVYLLKLSNGDYYAGCTHDLKKRLYGHSHKMVSTTSRNSPTELVFYAAFRSKEKALVFERYLKSSSGFAFRNKHLV